MTDREELDVQRIIRAILEKPYQPGDVTPIDGDMSIAELMSANPDMRARIVMAQAVQAGNGNTKAAEFVFKYAGYEPAQKTEVSYHMPTFVNDLVDVTPKAPEPDAIPQGSEFIAIRPPDEDTDDKYVPKEAVSRGGVRIICTETRDEFPSIQDAADWAKVSKKTMSKHVKDGGAVKGHHFERLA